MTRCLLPAMVVMAGVVLTAQAPARVDQARFLGHVKWLSSDELGGRGNGTEGLERAAQYIRERFQKAGLRESDQPFDAEVRVNPPASVPLLLADGRRRLALVLGRDYYPLSILDRPPHAPPPRIDEVPVVFAGYGISAPALHYDDFAEVDVRDAAVLVLTHEPQEHDPHSVFDGQHLTPGAALSQKAREARERGARLLMVVEDWSHASDRATRPAWWTDPQTENMGIPVVRVARDKVAEAFPALDLAQVARVIDETLVPQSRRLDPVRLTYVEHRAQFTARLENVIGVQPGADPTLAGEAIVVGAHYDHLGTGGEFSEALEATGEIHNGADDNASGVAALLEVARVAARTPWRFRRTVVFAAFAGEELGLRGSEQYVQAPPTPLERTRAMINLDMVGRARGRVMVGVFGPLAGPPLVPRLRPWTRLHVQDFTHGSGYSLEESDVGPFARHGVPAIAFFTGFHADYHRPSDDWPAIDAEGGTAVAALALRLLEELAR